MQRACVILNPDAGRGRGGRLKHALATALTRHAVSFEIRETTRPGEERALAQAAATDGWPVILAAGGDGTVHGVVNGLLDAGSQAALAVLPVGTGNDFHKMTGFRPGRPEQVIAALMTAVPRAFDVGRAAGEYFANSLGIGFGPAVLREMQGLRRLRGFALYLGAACRTFARFRPLEIAVESEDHHEEGPMMMTEVTIGTTAGGGFRLTPAADPADGRLDVCVIRKVGWLEFVRYLPRVMRGTHAALPPVTLFQTRRIVCRAAAPLDLHMDGELRRADDGRVEITVEPARLEVLCAA